MLSCHFMMHEEVASQPVSHHSLHLYKVEGAACPCSPPATEEVLAIPATSEWKGFTSLMHRL